MSRPSAPANEAARAVLMIRPAHFGRNPETLATNRFQSRRDGDAGAAEQARREFDALAAALDARGAVVHVFEGRHARRQPDEAFSNNWLSTHPDGTVVTYPLQAANRRLERRPDIVAWLERESPYRVTRTLDLSRLEDDGTYLEGTGSAVIDHRQRVAYCGLSPRTGALGVKALSDALSLAAETFATQDRDGAPVYHTNVLLAIGPTLVVVCPAAIAPADRARVMAALGADGREILTITLNQMYEFAANLLVLGARDGPVIALSARAWRAYESSQRRTLERHGTIVASDVATIETLGGGSVRCLLTEIWLPDREPAG